MKNSFLLFITVLLLTSCAVRSNNSEGNDDSKSEITSSEEKTSDIELFNLETFEAERKLWTDQNLRNYSFHISLSNHIDAGWAGRATVKNGVLDSFIFGEFREDDPNTEENRRDWADFRVPVSGIYDALIELRDRVEDPDRRVPNLSEPSKEDGLLRKYRYKLKVEYDNKYHFPRVCSYSVVNEQPVIGGYYYTMSIDGFTVIEP